MLYLIRHGESEANVTKRFSGITDVELSERGKKQAIAAGNRLIDEKILRIYSSPLTRAKKTAEIISSIIGYPKEEIIIENSLKEVNFGIFENMTWEEIEEEYEEESRKWIKNKHEYIFPEGEGYKDIIKRISSFVDNVPLNSLIVTHFGVIQSILLYLNIADSSTVWDYNISNCDILVLKNKKLIE